MSRRYPQGVDWSQAIANKMGPGVWQTTILLLACAFAALHHTAVEGRSFEASKPRPYTFRRLQSIDLPAGERGWTLGRASYNNPSDGFNRSFVPGLSPFQPALNGDCGWWSRNDRSDLSESLVPADMVAALATSNSDYPGSCGRCYELRCVNNIVPGNYSTDDVAGPVPYRIAPGQLKPVYDVDTINGAPPEDDYRRAFPGNVLNATDQLFTQCWNSTDAQGLLSPSGSIVVRVTDTCHCQTGSPSEPQACCTNIPHFNLGYQAFQKLAHPDYGLMNLMFRPVDCSTQTALPLEPGFINKTIYGNKVGTGWGVGGSAIRRLQQSQNGLPTSDSQAVSNASCFDLQKPKDELFFFCRNCDRLGYQPFLLSNTSGLGFYIRETRIMNKSDDDRHPSEVQVPQLTMTMGYQNPSNNGKVSYTQLCAGGALNNPQFASLRRVTRGLRRVNVLFQNNLRSCIPDLDQVTSFRFQSTGATSRVSFCMDDIQLLPSTLRFAGSGRPMPNYTNCVLPEPQPIDQEGRYTAGVQTQTTQNLTGYTVFPFTALQFYNNMNPLLGTCFANTTGLTVTPAMMQRVNDCTEINTICCYTANDQEGMLPDKLAHICDNMATNGSICQGFVYNSYTRVANFKGAPQTRTVDTSKLCLHPNTTAWLLNTALPPIQPDDRAIAKIVLEPAKPACSLSDQPSNQELRTLTSQYALPADAHHDVAANASVPAYTLFPHAALLDTPGMPCSVAPGDETTLTAVTTCTRSSGGACCVNLDNLQQSSNSTAVDSFMPNRVASICNNIKFIPNGNSSEDCQGFVYDTQQKRAIFKPRSAIILLGRGNLCANPTTYTWLLTENRGAVSPPQTPSSDESESSAVDKADMVWGVVGGVLGACVTFFTWLAVTYSYRMDKRMVITEVLKNLKMADIASALDQHQLAEQSAQATAQQQEALVSGAAVAAPTLPSQSLQTIPSSPTRGGLSMQCSSSSSRPMLSPTQSLSVLSFRSDSDVVQNPLLRALGLPYVAAPFHSPDNDNTHVDTMLGPTQEMKNVARQITVRCLRRWDGFLGIRASSDGLGRGSGIWRDKFDGVHYAVLLLAMNRLNETLSYAVGEPSCVLEAWQQGDRMQRSKLLDQLVRVLQSVSEEEAQALLDKDPERRSVYDRVCSLMICCA